MNVGSPPQSLGTACSLACHTHILHPRVPSTAQHWIALSHPLNGWLCDLGRGTSSVTSLAALSCYGSVSPCLKNACYLPAPHVTWAVVAAHPTPYTDPLLLLLAHPLPPSSHTQSPIWNWERNYGRVPVATKGTGSFSGVPDLREKLGEEEEASPLMPSHSAACRVPTS